MSRLSWQPDFASIDPSSPTWQKDWRDAIDWVRIEIDYETIKAEFIKWTKAEYPEYMEHLKKIPTWKFMSIGRVAYALNRNAGCADVTMSKFLNGVKELIDMPREVVEDTTTEYGVELPITKTKKSWDYISIYSFIEALIYSDQSSEHIEQAINKRLRTVEPSKQLLKKLYQHFKDSLGDAISAKADDSNVLNPDLLVTVINVLAQHSGNAKVAAKNQPKISRSIQKSTAKVNYKAIDTNTNVASIGPEQVPNTSIALIYNAKTRKIMIYQAQQNETLNIKGTKIVGFDPALSYAKILRKPKEILSSLQLAQNAKRVKLVLDQNVKGKIHAVNGRISKDMIIVKVFK